MVIMNDILRIFRKEYEKWLRKRRSRAIGRFRKNMMEAYPDGSRLLSMIHEVDCGDTKMPVFRIDANAYAIGFLSARGICASEAIAREIINILEERSHTVDISRVRIDGCHETGDFILKLRFDNGTAFKQL